MLVLFVRLSSSCCLPVSILRVYCLFTSNPPPPPNERTNERRKNERKRVKKEREMLAHCQCDVSVLVVKWKILQNIFNLIMSLIPVNNSWSAAPFYFEYLDLGWLWKQIPCDFGMEFFRLSAERILNLNVNLTAINYISIVWYTHNFRRPLFHSTLLSY